MTRPSLTELLQAWIAAVEAYADLQQLHGVRPSNPPDSNLDPEPTAALAAAVLAVQQAEDAYFEALSLRAGRRLGAKLPPQSP